MDSQAGLNRIRILGVPIDILPEGGIEEAICGLEDGKNHQIILLSVWDLVRARHSVEFRTMVSGASIVLPISLSIVKAARFLRKAEPKRYMPFDFAVALLSVLDRKGKSVYLLGARKSSLQRTEANLKSTFPGLRIVGRHAGRYPRHIEADIVEAVRKATPSLLLVGEGVPGGERWIPRNLSRFNAGLYLWCSDLFEVFADRRPKPSRELSEKGLEWAVFLARRPWRIYRAPVFLWFKFLLLLERIRG